MVATTTSCFLNLTSPPRVATHCPLEDAHLGPCRPPPNNSVSLGGIVGRNPAGLPVSTLQPPLAPCNLLCSFANPLARSRTLKLPVAIGGMGNANLGCGNHCDSHMVLGGKRMWVVKPCGPQHQRRHKATWHILIATPMSGPKTRKRIMVMVLRQGRAARAGRFPMRCPAANQRGELAAIGLVRQESFWQLLAGECEFGLLE